jgi:hypothetical protein
MPIVSPDTKNSSLADTKDSLHGSKTILECGGGIDSFVMRKPVGGTANKIAGIGRGSIVNGF